MTTFIPTTELDFLAYRESLKQYLKTQEAFKDYDYEGSNMAVLLDLLALNSLHNAYYENMIGSEMFLDTALLKNSVVSRAKELNYTPRSRSAARTKVSITFNTANSNPSSITIPKYYNFSSTSFDANNIQQTFNFVVNTAIVVQPDTFGNYVAQNVSIYQGKIVSEAFVNDGTRFILQANTIDIDSIEVSIENSNTDNTAYTWTRAINIYGLNEFSNVFFVQAYNDDQYELVFGNDVIGRALTSDNIVKVKYISTDGDAGNGLKSFSPSTAVEGYQVVSVIANARTTGGSERESIESIRFQAPRYFTTQERAVTEDDFENLVRINFPNIQSVIAYGGETLNPPRYGAVAISLKPYGLVGNVSNSIKDQIVQFLNTKSMTTPLIIDPEYFYLNVISTVYYTLDDLSKSIEQLKADVVQAIYEFGQENLQNFGSDLRYSKLIKAIDDADRSITSNDTTIQIVKRFNPVANTSEDVKIDFGIPFAKYDLEEPFSPGYGKTLNSSLFSYSVGGVNYSAFFDDDGLGNIRVIANNSRYSVIVSNAGTIDYANGIVVLSKTLSISSYGGGYIKLNLTTANKDITVNNHRFLILDTSDINVTVQRIANG